jgi:hypothetical protein
MSVEPGQDIGEGGLGRVHHPTQPEQPLPALFGISRTVGAPVQLRQGSDNILDGPLG